MEEIQDLTDQQLQDANEEKERVLAQLKALEKKVGLFGFIKNTAEVRPFHVIFLCPA